MRQKLFFSSVKLGWNDRLSFTNKERYVIMDYAALYLCFFFFSVRHNREKKRKLQSYSFDLGLVVDKYSCHLLVAYGDDTEADVGFWGTF
ncbi:hypothetical protein BDC45DRAFT_300034 [Circinella umbellata]|nr:hypothetical protein BDC45DRAFT_300034 [Circinella umbellata]